MIELITLFFLGMAVLIVSIGMEELKGKKR